MELRDYQVTISDQAVDLLKKYKIAYLALQVRVGKTLTAIATAYKYGAKKVLFVTKKKAISDIIAQARQLGYDLPIYITNYEQLHNVTDEGFDLVIIDEAHSLGAFARPSVRAKELKVLCKDKPIIYLSGTPTPETYSQLFHQLWVSSFSPFKHPNFYAWVRDGYVFVKQRKINGYMVNDYKNANKDKIDKETNYLFITYTQEQAGFESMVEEKVLFCKMLNDTYRLADHLKKHKIAQNSEGEVILADTEVKLMNKLHQVYSGTVIVDEPYTQKVIDYSKVEFIEETFKGQKIAIYYKFQAELAALKWKLTDKITFDANEFNNSKDLIFVSQIQSGREGINISTADALVFMNIDFSAVSYWQSRARIQTRDREKESKIYYIFSVGGIEEKIHKAVMQKQDFTLSYFKDNFLNL